MNNYKPLWVPIFDEFDLVSWVGLEGNIKLASGELVKTVEKLAKESSVSVTLHNGDKVTASWGQLLFGGASLGYICGDRQSTNIYLPIDSSQFMRSSRRILPFTYKECIEISEGTVNQLRLVIRAEIADTKEQDASLFKKKCSIVHNAFTAFNERNLKTCLYYTRMFKFDETRDMFTLLLKKMEPVARALISEALRLRKYSLASDLIRTFPREAIDAEVEHCFVNEFTREIQEDLDFGYQSEAMRMAHLAGFERLPGDLVERLHTDSDARRVAAEKTFFDCISRTDLHGAVSLLDRLSKEYVSELHGVRIGRLMFVAKRLRDITDFQDIVFCHSIIVEIANEELRNAFINTLRTVARSNVRQLVASSPSKEIEGFVFGHLIKEKEYVESLSLLDIYVEALESAIKEMPVNKGPIKLGSVAKRCARLNHYAISAFPFSQIAKLAKSLEVYDFVKASYSSSKLGNQFPADKWINTTQKELASKIARLLGSGRYREARKMYCQVRFYNHRQNRDRKRLLEVFVSKRRSDAIGRINDVCLPIVSDIIQCKSPVVHIAPELDEGDYQLIFTWSGRDQISGERSRIEGVVDSIGDYEAARLYTARGAELVGLDIYGRLYGDVQDISQDQRVSSSSALWKKCDIVADDRFVDIKAARSSFNNPNRYSEFRVSAFKTISSGEDVYISAMFSKYQSSREISLGKGIQFLWLGEASKTHIERIFNFIKGVFGETFDISNFKRIVQSGFFLPGWLFDYPKEFYAGREKGVMQLEECKRLLGYAQRHSASDVKYPTSIWGNCVSGLSHTEQKVAQTFIEMKKKCGLDRGAIFLTCLGLCLESAGDPSFNLAPSDLRKFLFLEGESHRQLQPLGALDPMGFVEELISSLEIVFQRSQKELSAFCSFRLAGKGLLQGKNRQGQWKTILAYCGGEVRGYGVKCGNSPLVLGLHHSCRKCGKLICDKCGFCGTACSDCYSSNRINVSPGDWYTPEIETGFDPFSESALSNPDMFSNDLSESVF